MRPLQKNAGERMLQVQVGRGYRERTNLPSPLKSPRSFRSSFLMPGKGDTGQNSSNRNLEGAEKLSSGASSPRLERMDDGSKKAPSPKQRGRLGRVYQYFDGNMVFCLGGRWQNTRSQPVNVATGLFVVTPVVLFGVFSAPWLWTEISPAIPITFAYVFYICFSSFIHASVSDPGVRLSTSAPIPLSLSPVANQPCLFPRFYPGIFTSFRLRRMTTRCE